MGIPHYFHIMISFATHLLLEVASTYYMQLSIDVDFVFTLVGQVVTLFSSTSCIIYHPVHRIAVGLASKLTSCMDSAKESGALTSPQAQTVLANTSIANVMPRLDGAMPGNGTRIPTIFEDDMFTDMNFMGFGGQQTGNPIFDFSFQDVNYSTSPSTYHPPT